MSHTSSMFCDLETKTIMIEKKRLESICMLQEHISPNKPWSSVPSGIPTCLVFKEHMKDDMCAVVLLARKGLDRDMLPDLRSMCRETCREVSVPVAEL